jgi:hypothetical protein
MPLPLIDLSLLPDLGAFTGAHPTGIFGSLPADRPGTDDSIVVLATFLYDAAGGARV